MQTALSTGANFWNGGEFYGTPSYNSLHLLKQYFSEHPSDAEKVVISIKGGIDPIKHVPDGTEEGVRRSMDNCLAGLDGKKFLDIFECARVDPNTPIETTIGALAKYVKEGKLGGISLSEVKAETIRRAAKVHPIAAVEVELSLWCTDILENGIAATCAELDIPVVAYCPLGRGFLTGEIKKIEDLPEDDMRRRFPRFQSENFGKNVEMVTELEKLAKKKGYTPAQLALAWVKQLSGKKGMPVIIPIPGATTEKRVIENMKDVELNVDDLSEIDEILKKLPVIGDRYGPPYAHLMNG
jgi:pyridoxine 4-dehydrogenase